MKIKTVAEGKKVAKEIIEKAFGSKSTVEINPELSVTQVQERLNQFKNLTDEYSVGNQFEDQIIFKMASTSRTYGKVVYVGQRTFEGEKYKVRQINVGHKTDPNRSDPERVSSSGSISEKSKVDAKNLNIATLTHEFAHVITNNKISVNYSTDANAKKFWTSMNNLENEYKREVSLLKNKRDFESLNKIYLGRYASTNSEEFLAEGFTEYKLNSNPSKYAVKIGELVDKHFKN